MDDAKKEELVSHYLVSAHLNYDSGVAEERSDVASYYTLKAIFWVLVAILRKL